MGKGGSANWKNIDLSRKIQGLQKPCVLKKPPVWSDTRSSLLFFNLTAIKQESGWHERLSISFILRHITRSRIHSSVSSKYSAIKGYKGNPESPRSFIKRYLALLVCLVSFWEPMCSYSKPTGQLQTIEASWLAETPSYAYCRNFIFPVLPAMDHFLHFPKSIFSEMTRVVADCFLLQSKILNILRNTPC